MDTTPQTPGERKEPELLSIAEIAERHHVTRQTIHNLRRRGVFPEPESTPGSTRLRWSADAVAAYFAANPKQPGKKIEKRLSGTRQSTRPMGPTEVTPDEAANDATAGGAGD